MQDKQAYVRFKNFVMLYALQSLEEQDGQSATRS